MRLYSDIPTDWCFISGRGNLRVLATRHGPVKYRLQRRLFFFWWESIFEFIGMDYDAGSN